jgi:uncharacterized protein Usg
MHRELRSGAGRAAAGGYWQARKIALHAYAGTGELCPNQKRGTQWFQKISVTRSVAYGLTTAHILYRRPDHRWLLQSYVWQNYDLFPEFPELHRFLTFWQEKLEGPLHSVRVSHCKLIKPAELKAIDREFRLH